jgi:hypothetical protein
MTKIILAPARLLPSVQMIREDVPGEATMRSVNKWAQRELKPEDVHVRRAFGIHDAVDTFHSRFPVESLRVVAGKAPGAPVLVGHNDRGNELARIFASSVVYRPEVEQMRVVPGVGENNWTAFDFYWMRAHSRAEDLALEIDGGIKREVSLRWAFSLPKCSICEGDMRECDHMPGKTYEEDRVAYYDMYEIDSVRELSFVYRGGQLGTAVELLRHVDGRSAKEIVDAFIKASGLATTDEERDGMVEFARCYDGSKLTKKEQRDGWFDSLQKREPKRLSWWMGARS